MNQSLVIWGFILIFGFPTLTVLLGQFGESLRRREHPLAPFIVNLQKLVLPPLSILLIARKILAWQEGGIALQLLETLLGIAIIYTCLSFFKVLLIAEPKKYFWQVSVPDLLFQVIRASLVIVIGAYILANTWNIDLTQAAQALGVGSLVIALALQDTLSNLVSGFLLLADSPFKKGDWLQIDDRECQVLDINWRAVRLITRDKDLLVIPNGSLGKQNILNYSQPTTNSEVEFFVKFSRNDPPNRVMQVLREVYEQVPGTSGHLETGIESFDDFAISYIVDYKVTDFWDRHRSPRHFKALLYYAAKRKGLTMPYPTKYQYTIDSTAIGSQQEQQENQQDILEFLLSLPYFRSVSSEVLTKLIPDTTFEYYGTGEQIVYEGEFVQGLYLIQNGKAQLTIKDARGSETVVDRISHGDFFGESVFMSG
ncbi:MAG: mechanosensitive ion channel family protein, partial [Cyanobacteriota bacterium]|nr:mechanosensitive ion channel family protein [Cyanobacteriota bacterium]